MQESMGTKDKLWSWGGGGDEPEEHGRDEAVVGGSQTTHSLQFHVKSFGIFCKEKDRALKSSIREG